MSEAEIVLIWDNDGIAIANNVKNMKVCIKGKPEVLDVCLPIKTQSLETSRFVTYLKTNAAHPKLSCTRNIISSIIFNIFNTDSCWSSRNLHMEQYEQRGCVVFYLSYTLRFILNWIKSSYLMKIEIVDNWQLAGLTNTYRNKF